MMKTIKTTEANREVVATLTRKLNMGPENIIARIAFAYSLSLEKKLDITDVGDSKGKEYSSKVLFGDYPEIYLAAICQLYQINITNFDIPKYVKMHIDDGLEKISQITNENPRLLLLDFLFEQVEKGLRFL